MTGETQSEPKGSSKNPTESANARKPTAGPSGAGSPPEPKVDLSAWKVATGTVPEPRVAPPKTDRPQYPLVRWEDLAGIRGLGVFDVWLADSNPATSKGNRSYPYVGTNVLLPPRLDAPMMRVTVLTGQDTVAGARLKAEFMRGAFDLADEAHPVAVHVTNRESPDPERRAKPYSVLTFA